MNFLKSIMPDSWYLKLFTPPEDLEENNPSGVFFHIRSPNISLPLRLSGTSRYDVVNFFQDYHDNNISQSLSQKDLVDHINKLFLLDINEDTSNEELLNYIKLFKSFQQDVMVFVRPSFLSIDHNLDDNKKWVTTFTKTVDNNMSNNKVEIIASINAYKNYTFPDEKEIVSAKDF